MGREGAALPAVVAAIVLALAVAVCFYPSSTKSNGAGGVASSTTEAAIQLVPVDVPRRGPCESDLHCVLDCAARQVPAVLELEVSNALASWSPHLVASAVTDFHSVLSHSCAGQHLACGVFFHIDAAKPMARRAKQDSAWKSPYELTTVASEFFLKSASHVQYWSGSVAMLREAAVDQNFGSDVSPFLSLRNAITGHIGALQGENVQSGDLDALNVWIGNDNATSRLHYDAANNVYTQLHGEKEFVLIPPKYHAHLYTLPFLHPSSRQCAVPLEEWRRGARGLHVPREAAARFPMLRSVNDGEILRITLRAGDSLYIPAFWYHHVTALRESVSLSFYFPSVEKQVATTVLDCAVPFVTRLQSRAASDGDGKGTMLSASWMLLYDLFSALHDGEDHALLREKIMRIVSSRYNGALSVDPIIPGSVQWFRSATPVPCSRTLLLPQSRLRKLVTETFSTVAKELQAVERGVAEVVWSDLLEVIVSATVGLNALPSAVVHCVRSFEGIE